MSSARSDRSSGGERPASARRFDPERRDRIIDAALELIAEVGVAGTSHRKIAARADVPLGSMTYHFAGMDELLAEAFTRFALTISDRFERTLDAAREPDAVIDAIVDLVHHEVHAGTHDLVLTLELYTLAAREPAFRSITESWMARSRVALERHLDPETARAVDAAIEGLSIHLALAPTPHDRALTREAIARLVR